MTPPRLFKCFAFRLLALVFIGTHIPLVCLLVWYLSGPGFHAGPGMALVISLAGTLLAAGITMLLVHRQVRSLTVAAQAVAASKPGVSIPVLPKADTQEVEQLFTAIRRSFEKSQKLVDEKRDLVSMLSHDLSSPATAVLGALHVLERDPDLDNTTRQRLYQQLAMAARHQIELVGSIMGLMRLDMDDELGMEPSSLPELLSATLDRVRAISDAKGILLDIKVPAISLPVYPFLFKQAVENLLINAIKYSYPGQTVQLQVEIVDGQAVIRVIDEGLGFDSEEAKQLLQAKPKKGRPGTAGEKTNGMGLYLVKRTAERHRGHLHIHSAGRGKGAEFAMYLPMAA